MKFLFKFLLSILILLGTLIPSTSALATPPANPDSITVHTAKAFENIFETGDMLFVVSYDVAYASEPSTDASDNFLVNLLDTAGATLYMSRPLEDYQYNVISIWVSPSNVTSLGLTTGTAYKLRITGNPAIFTTLTEGTNMRTRTLSASDWLEDGTIDSEDLLALHIVDIAESLESDWAVVLLVTASDGSQVLNSAGRTTFLVAIPGIDTILPNSFQATSTAVIIDILTSNATLLNNSTIANRLGPQISAAFSGIGTWLGMSEEMAGGLWALIFLLTLASIVFLGSGNSTGAIICIFPMAIGLSFVGAMPIALLFTVVILLVAYAAYFLILRGI